MLVRLITSTGAEADMAVDELRKVVAAIGKTADLQVEQREPYPKAGLDRESLLVDIRADRDVVVRLYDSLRRTAALGWTDINDADLDAVWNERHDEQRLLATVQWAAMSATGTDGTTLER